MTRLKIARKVAFDDKKNLIKWGGICLIVINLVMTGCSPQHNYTFQQFNAEQKGVIFSIQGYVISSPEEIKDLKEKWNTLAGEMSKKLGFIDGHLSLGIGGSKLILAHSKWENLESLRNAFSDERILELEERLPKNQFQHLFTHGDLGTYFKEFKTP